MPAGHLREDPRHTNVRASKSGGERPRSFVSSTRLEYAPQYSPDGKHVAFTSDRSGLQQVWVCDRDGGNPAQLTHFDAETSGTPRWSPDGRWIAFDHHEKERWRIYVMAWDGGQVRRLAQDDGDAEVIPSWSGDGKWIYYASNRTGRFEIWKRAGKAGQEMQLTHNGGWAASSLTMADCCITRILSTVPGARERSHFHENRRPVGTSTRRR